MMAGHPGAPRDDLDRYVHGQTGVYDRVLDELRGGHKESHWMWFVFPQIVGLGEGDISRRYAIRSLDEARAYLHHPLLGDRLRECVQLVLASVAGSTAEAIFGSTDARKLRSSMTLFHRAAPDEPLFSQALDRFFGGMVDEATDARLGLRPDARES